MTPEEVADKLVSRGVEMLNGEVFIGVDRGDGAYGYVEVQGIYVNGSGQILINTTNGIPPDGFLDA